MDHSAQGPARYQQSQHREVRRAGGVGETGGADLTKKWLAGPEKQGQAGGRWELADSTWLEASWSRGARAVAGSGASRPWGSSGGGAAVSGRHFRGAARVLPCTPAVLLLLLLSRCAGGGARACPGLCSPSLAGRRGAVEGGEAAAPGAG